MFLRTLTLKKFRSYGNAILQFDEYLTVLAGENNAGKSTIMDALRLLTAPNDPHKERYPDENDITRGSPAGTAFELVADFDGLSDEQKGLFIGALTSWDSRTCRYGLTYTPPAPNERRGHSFRHCGISGTSDPEPEARSLIRHVYLPPLRDAVRELASSNPGRIELLLKSISTEESKAAFLKTAGGALRAIEEHALLAQAIQLLTEDIAQLTNGVQLQNAHLHFADATLASLARDLRLSLSTFGLPRVDLRESGLGYANLLYLACVLVELRRAKDHELTLFLVEEPEAHLHPQLQAATLAYLQEQAQKSVLPKHMPGQHAGRVQIVVSTHSPILTSRVSPLHLVILSPAGIAKSKDADADQAPGAVLDKANVSEPGVVVLRRVALPEQVVRKLQRYLDVTRSSLLFSRRVILVEGISDAIMLDEFGRILFKDVPQKFSAFRAATIIPVGGVDFAPFVRLLLTTDSESNCCIARKVVVLTDEDPDSNSAMRPSELVALGNELNQAHRLAVHICPLTLEAALLTPDTMPALRDAYLTLHPRSSDKWDKYMHDASDKAAGAALVDLLKSSQTSKPEFCQISIEELLKSERRFSASMIPEIFRAALADLLE